MRTIFAIIIIIPIFLKLNRAAAFVPPCNLAQAAVTSRTECLLANTDENNESTCSRRQYWAKTGQIFGSVFLTANPAFAKDDLAAEKKKIVDGYKRLNYLLDNWEKETTDCKTKTQYSSASNECERTPLVVQYYLGYKSIEDPLFKADKTMRKLEVLVPQEDVVDYLEAMETFSEKAEEGSGMAYVSSWGEANPGGGKDRIEYFVERAKQNVIDARDSLGVIIRILKLETA